MGLWGKLILAIFAVGTIPIVMGLSVAYVKGSAELQKVMGESFQALAKDSASKLDREIQLVIEADSHLALLAAADPRVRDPLARGNRAGAGAPRPARPLDWPLPGEIRNTHKALAASRVAGAAAVLGGDESGRSTAPHGKTMLSGLRHDSNGNRHVFRISTPERENKNQTLIGWLQRDYDAGKILDPLT